LACTVAVAAMISSSVLSATAAGRPQPVNPNTVIIIKINTKVIFFIPALHNKN
jgi:hypothetical protein